MVEINCNQKLLFPILRQVLNALQYLHGESIIHGNIKPSNILVADRDLSSIKVQVDIDTAVSFTAAQQPYCGSKAFMAPEKAEKKSYNEKIDIWSLGMVGGLFQIYHQLSRRRLGGLEAIRHVLKERSSLSKVLQDMLDIEPNRRASIVSALSSLSLEKTMQAKRKREPEEEQSAKRRPSAS